MWSPGRVQHPWVVELETWVVALGVAAVQQRKRQATLGHDGTRMTASVYRHAVRPTVAAGVAPMERLFRS